MSGIEIISTSKTDLSLAKQLAKANAAVWAETRLKNEFGEPWSFAERVYQIEPMMLRHPKVSVRKATQGGWTLAFMAVMLHLMIQRIVRRGVIYLFPTDVKVSEFSQRRWTGLLDHNPYAIGRHVSRTNNVHTKRVGTANLMMIGGQLTHRMSVTDAESAALRSDPADVIVCEEKDLIPVYAMGKARGRLGASALGWEWSLSNPTIPGYGIDADYEAGDQRNWGVRCAACNHWTFLEVEFPHVLRRLADGRVIRACVKCGRELGINQGQWVPKFRDRSADHVSYWWSQLNSHSPSSSPSVILGEWENPPEGNLGDVKRLRLGLPHLDAQYGLTENEVLLCCTDDPPAANSHVATAAGVDVGKVLHVTIGQRIAKDAYRLSTCLLVQDWDELKKVFRAFNVEVASIDNEPELRDARSFQAETPGQIWLSDYVESVAPAAYDAKTRVVKVNRNEILDDTHFYLTAPGRFFLPKATALVRQFAKECAAMAKVVAKDPATGKMNVQYLSTGPDHFRHSFANFLLAARLQVPTMMRTTRTSERPSRTGYDLFD